MTKLLATAAGAVLLVALGPASPGFSASCTIVDGQYRYGAAGERVKSCPKLAKRDKYKVISSRKVTEPRCAGKPRGYSFVRKKPGGKLTQIVCGGGKPN